MNWLFIILTIVLLSQVILYVYSRKLKRELKNNVMEKYNLKTPKDAWNALADQETPKEDKAEIRKYYNGEE